MLQNRGVIVDPGGSVDLLINDAGASWDLRGEKRKPGLPFTPDTQKHFQAGCKMNVGFHFWSDP